MECSSRCNCDFGTKQCRFHMQYALTRGASLLLVLYLLSSGNLSQVEPLPAYFGCRDVNNVEVAYRILSLAQKGYAIMWWVGSKWQIYSFLLVLFWRTTLIFVSFFTSFISYYFAFCTHYISRCYMRSRLITFCVLLWYQSKQANTIC